MCDPLIGGLISGAAAIAGGMKSAGDQQAVIDAQNQANAQWVAYQTQIHQEQVAEENKRRQMAETARQDTLTKTSPEAYKQIQQTEQQRLNQFYLQPGPQTHDPNVTASMALSGQTSDPNTISGSDLAKQVSNATSQARQRIAALATANSFGGSTYGAGTEMPIRYAQGGNIINLEGNIRNANLQTYRTEQQVEPIHYTIGPGTQATADMSKALGGLAGSLVGSGISKGWS
jgi:hypothetical protein